MKSLFCVITVLSLYVVSVVSTDADPDGIDAVMFSDGRVRKDVLKVQATQTFELGKPINDQAIVCLHQKDAMDIVDAEAKGVIGVVANIKLQQDVCRVLQLTIVYHELVYETRGKDGATLSVYRGVVNGKTLFVPMSGWVGVTPEYI